jgi:Leucine-rich repeat (LRR) protein
VAATSKLVLSARTPDDLDSMLLYLRQHGAIVRKVFISKAPKAASLSQLQSLPASCSQLQDLTISACNLVNLPSMLSGLTSLTRLDVSNSDFAPAAPAALMPLSQMTALQHLKFTLWPSRTTDVPFPAGVLSHLTSLTHPDLGESEVNESTVGGIQSLTNLRECRLGARGGTPHHRIVFASARVKPQAVAAVSVLQQLTLLSITSAYDITNTTAPVRQVD